MNQCCPYHGRRPMPHLCHDCARTCPGPQTLRITEEDRGRMQIVHQFEPGQSRDKVVLVLLNGPIQDNRRDPYWD